MGVDMRELGNVDVLTSASKCKIDSGAGDTFSVRFSDGTTWNSAVSGRPMACGWTTGQTSFLPGATTKKGRNFVVTIALSSTDVILCEPHPGKCGLQCRGHSRAKASECRMGC